MSNHSLIIHGHFYQPPREDPFSGVIPPETGADPFSNWNERIHAECYAPNARLGNFEKISFNIGPTLFEWMEKYHRTTNEEIIGQDKRNVVRYGIGNALAQPYHHTILPLASRQDKITQISWGITEFKTRFGRKPQGMWLPEAAVDMETLEILADQDIHFTILAPWQAEAQNLDSTEPYNVDLDQGKRIDVFFYQQDLSSGISFSPTLTANADQFLVEHVLNQYHLEKSRRGEPQLLLLASDGELYGHHQKFRDQFLSHLVNGASSKRSVHPTYPALWLRDHPTRQTIRIRENTSWSCQHGVIRWKGDCDCIQTDGDWKAYLRQACDILAKDLDDLYSQVVKPSQVDPWELRDQYIHVILGEYSADRLIDDMAGFVMPTKVKSQMIQMLEAQLFRQKMYASCAWFFDDFNRIEPKNCLANAARAVNLVRMAVGVDLATEIRVPLAQIASSRSGLRGDQVFDRQLERIEKR